MINYSLSITVGIVGGKRSISRHINTSASEYNMLNYLSINNEEATSAIIENLEKVIKGELTVYDPWGADFCIIASHKDTSEVQYYDFETDDLREKPLFIHIPTHWLLNIMKDWKKFLERNPVSLYMEE